MSGSVAGCCLACGGHHEAASGECGCAAMSKQAQPRMDPEVIELVEAVCPTLVSQQSLLVCVSPSSG